MFNSIDYNPSNEWRIQPKNLSTRFVCQESGQIPDENCEQIISDFFIPKISNSEKCTHLKNAWVSPDQKISYCPNCLPQSGFKNILFRKISTDLKDYYKSQNIPYETIPEHNPLCDRLSENKGLKIISPTSDKHYIVEKDDPAEIMLKCIAPYDSNILYWYINNRFYAQTLVSDKLFFKPPPGKVNISCADDKGRHVAIDIEISYQ